MSLDIHLYQYFIFATHCSTVPEQCAVAVIQTTSIGIDVATSQMKTAALTVVSVRPAGLDQISRAYLTVRFIPEAGKRKGTGISQIQHSHQHNVPFSSRWVFDFLSCILCCGCCCKKEEEEHHRVGKAFYS